MLGTQLLPNYVKLSSSVLYTSSPASEKGYRVRHNAGKARDDDVTTTWWSQCDPCEIRKAYIGVVLGEPTVVQCTQVFAGGAKEGRLASESFLLDRLNFMCGSTVIDKDALMKYDMLLLEIVFYHSVL